MNVIQFPKLGLEFHIDPVAFRIGNLSVYWYGILIAAAFLVAILLALKDSEKYSIKQDDLIDMLIIAVPLAIIGARLFYVIFHWSYYKNDLSEIYKTWHGGIAIYGGIIIALPVVLLICRARKLNALKMLDFMVVYLLVGQVIGRWGNFVNQELFGTNTDMPWGMTGDVIKKTIISQHIPGLDPEKLVHPVFLYEVIWNLLGVFLLLWFRKRKKLDGEVLSLYMIIYGAGRFWIEMLRTDSFNVGKLRVNMILGAVFIVIFAALFIYRRKKLAERELEQIEDTGERVYASLVEEMHTEEKERDVEKEENGLADKKED